MRHLRRFLKRELTIEDRLRAERPEPPDRLVRSIVDSIPTRSSRRMPARGLGRVAVLSGGVLTALFALGGLGYAMGAGSDLVVKITSANLGASQSALRTVAVDAANDQYHTTTGGGGGGGGGGAPTTTISHTTPSGGAITVVPGTTGSVNVTTPSGIAVSVVWDATTFGPASVNVRVNPNPPITGVTLLGSGNHLISVNVTNPATGQPIHALSKPLDILFKNPPAGFVPSVSENGVTYRALKQISGPPLPAGMQDGYYVDSSGNVHILTMHVTIFAVLFKANVTQSETGRTLAPAGSGKFGDPTRIHVGPPALHFVNAPQASGRNVHFTFFVDEQAAMYFRLISGGKSQTISVTQSAIRAHRLTGPARRTLHVVVLRPGTIRVSLRAASGTPQSLSMTAVDYDGNKVTQTAKVK